MDERKGGKGAFLCAGFFLAAVLVALDRYTKHLAVRSLREKPSRVLIPGVLELTYVENRGAAFGMLQNAQIFFVVITVVILAAVLYVLFRMPATKRYLPLYLTLSVIIAGAVGNLIDRCTTVYVVDFIYVSLIDFPVFNVADICVTVATALLLVLGIWYYKEDDFSFLHR